MFSARIWVFYQKTISQIIEISVNAEKNSVISRYNASLDPSSDLIERVPHTLEGISKQQRSLYRAPEQASRRLSDL